MSIYSITSSRLPWKGPGVSIFRDTRAVQYRRPSSIPVRCRSVIYPAKVVSPRPVRPERFRALTGQVSVSYTHLTLPTTTRV